MFELKKYCSMDVKLLRQGCLKFMQNFVNVLDINPFTEASTLAPAVMLGFRKKFLIENTLSIIPSNNYCINKNQSKIGKKWLVYEKHFNNNNTQINYEYKIDSIYVEGYDPSTNTVYEFFGCYFHGCIKCFKYRKYNLRDAKNIYDRHESSMLRINKLQQMGYIVNVKWECDFKNFLNGNQSIDTQLSKEYALHYDMINCRNAIYGGRTEVFST